MHPPYVIIMGERIQMVKTPCLYDISKGSLKVIEV